MSFPPTYAKRWSASHQKAPGQFLKVAFNETTYIGSNFSPFEHCFQEACARFQLPLGEWGGVSQNCWFCAPPVVKRPKNQHCATLPLQSTPIFLLNSSILSPVHSFTSDLRTWDVHFFLFLSCFFSLLTIIASWRRAHQQPPPAPQPGNSPIKMA